MQTLYLDTGDLSVLAVGRLGGDVARVDRWRHRLRALLVAGRTRLAISDVAVSELAARRDATAGLSLLRGVPNVVTVSGWFDVFKAELRGEDVALTFRPLDVDRLAAYHVPLWKLPGVRLPGRQLGRWLLKFRGWWAHSQNRGKAERRRDTPEGSRVRDAVMRGEIPDRSTMGFRPWVYAAVAAALARFAHRRGGWLEQVIEVVSNDADGLAWARAVGASDLRGPTTRWSAEQVQRMPATALRGAVECRHHGDLTRPYDIGTFGDLHHLAYVAHVDVGTVDGTTLDLTKEVRRHLDRPAVFRTGNLDPVLDHLEQSTEGRPGRDSNKSEGGR